MAFSPDAGLLLSADGLGFAGMITRAGDGAMVSRGALESVFDIDARFENSLAVVSDGLEVRALASDTQVARFIDDDAPLFVNAAFSPSGERIAAISCANNDPSLLVGEIASATFDLQLPIDATVSLCSQWGVPDFFVSFGADDDTVVVGVAQTGTVHVFDLTAQTQEVHVVHAAPELPENAFLADTRLVSLVVDATGSILLTAGADQRLRRFKLPDMVEIGAPIEVGVVLVNAMTYATPRLSSPVAISPDGKVIAALSPSPFPSLARSGTDTDTAPDQERALPVLLDFKTGSVLDVLDEIPAPPPTTPLPDEYDRAVAFAFSPSGRALAVRFVGGQGLWSCADFATPSPTAPIAAEITGPETISAGEIVTYTVSHAAPPGALVAHGFYVDGQLRWGGGFARTWRFSQHTPGTYELSVVLDDGANAGSASLTITVEP